MKKKVVSGQLRAGPTFAGCTLYYDDGQRIVCVDGRSVYLTPTEYVLCKSLIDHALRMETGRAGRPFVGYQELEACAGLPRHLVRRHLQNADLKLRALTPLAIGCDGRYGYVLFREEPVEADLHQWPDRRAPAFAYAV
jgi:hypothetical protein